ncbi:MAG TPA: hypothetical protein VMT46_04710 [Anaerolineaceae bacterium]|nr:hypothetical protein [Anaerolineaceae bacterium]
MNKPLCKVTLQDLLDSMQTNDKAGKRNHPQFSSEKESLNDWLSLEEIAEDLNINPNLLYACMNESENVGTLQTRPSILWYKLHIKH